MSHLSFVDRNKLLHGKIILLLITVRNRLVFFLNLRFECKSHKKNFRKVIFKKIIMIEN